MSKYGDIRWKWLAEKGFNVLADKHQYAYMQSLWSPIDVVHAVFCDSPAGTGKTTLAVLAGIYEVEKGTYDKIIYIRNAVPIRNLGYLPGTLAEKEEPFMKPLIEAMDHVQPGLYHKWSNSDDKGSKKVYAFTSAFERGVTYKNAFVIIDECQNMELYELQALYTRCDDSCKIVSIGSTRQVDNQKLKKIAGLTPFEVYMEHFKGYKATYHKLETNYRGEFSKIADKVMETVEKLENNIDEFGTI